MHVRKPFAVAVLMASAAISLAQQPTKPESKAVEKSPPPIDGKTKLEELLAEALRQNPEVLLAETKLREAEANLRQTRMQVAQKLAEAYSTREIQQRLLENATSAYAVTRERFKQGHVSPTESINAENQMLAMKRQLTQLEATVNGLAGRLPSGQSLPPEFEMFRISGTTAPHGGGMAGGSVSTLPDEPMGRMPNAAMTDRLEKVLDQTVQVGDKGFQDVRLREVTDFVRQQMKDVPCLVNLAQMGDEKVKIDFRGETKLAGFLQMLGDAVPDMRVVVRDYGLLITIAGQEPADGMTVHTFQGEVARSPRQPRK